MVNLQFGKYESKIMTIIPKSIEMMSETLLSQYFITGWKLGFKNKGEIPHIYFFQSGFVFQTIDQKGFI